MIYYLIGMVISFLIGGYRLNKEGSDIYEYFILFLLSLFSWFAVFALLLGGIVKSNKHDEIMKRNCEELRMKAKRQEKFKL